MATLILYAVALIVVLVPAVVLTYAVSRILKRDNATWRRAFGKVALIGILSLVAVGFSIALPFRWYAAEAYVIPTNTMAPNVCGHRVEGVCPECGGMVVMTVDNPPPPGAAPQPELGGCVRCGKEWEPAQCGGRPFSGDRIIAAKWNKNARWDAVVYRNPLDERVFYLKRIVGLPGEEVAIGDDGFLVVDGKRIEPPPEFAELRYTYFPNDPMMKAMDDKPLWGSPNRPIRLGPDEYFLLGDNTRRALDSRFWGPLKRDAIIATATMIYWPPSRWRIFK